MPGHMLQAVETVFRIPRGGCPSWVSQECDAYSAVVEPSVTVALLGLRVVGFFACFGLRPNVEHAMYQSVGP